MLFPAQAAHLQTQAAYEETQAANKHTQAVSLQTQLAYQESSTGEIRIPSAEIPFSCFVLSLFPFYHGADIKAIPSM